MVLSFFPTRAFFSTSACVTDECTISAGNVLLPLISVLLNADYIVLERTGDLIMCHLVILVISCVIRRLVPDSTEMLPLIIDSSFSRQLLLLLLLSCGLILW